MSKDQVNGYPLLDEETVTASDDTDDTDDNQGQGQDDAEG